MHGVRQPLWGWVGHPELLEQLPLVAGVDSQQLGLRMARKSIFNNYVQKVQNSL